jgi:hypothetical protein
MSLDFWNNPLVVSALRVDNRRRGLVAGLTMHVAFLACACMVAWYCVPLLGGPLEDDARMRLIFGGLFIVEAALSGFMAMGMTFNAVSVEVATGTLDYQRLTRLTPVQVAAGKLLGPPTRAYLMALGSVPFSFGLWTLGGAAISFGTLLLLYLQVASTALFGGALGLLGRLEAAPSQKSPQQEVSGIGCFIALMVVVPGFSGLSTLPALLSRWETAPLVGLFLPTGSFVGLWQFQDPWHYALRFFGVGVPFLLVTPLVQLTAVALCVHVMSRRLTNTAAPTLSKPLAYALLTAIDVLAAAVLFDPVNLELAPRSRYFWLCHVLMVFLLARTVTPDRELLRTWIWRFRECRARLGDLWREDRSENILVLLTFCAIGLLVFLLLVLLPALLAGGWDAARPANAGVTAAPLLATTLTLSLGTLFQALVAVFGRGGAWLLAVAVILDATAFVCGSNFQVKALMECSAMAQWWSWQPLQEPLDLRPVLGLHVALFAVAWTVLRRYVRLETRRVERKLREMGLGGE